MPGYSQIDEVAVDRREETVVTQQPGYTSTLQVTRDVAGEQRLKVFQLTRILNALLVFLEVLLGMRYVLKLIGADPASSFATLVYGMTWLFLAPFTGLIATPTSGGSILEMTTLIAMAIYVLVVWGIVTALPIVLVRSRARSTSRSTVERVPGVPGNKRLTRRARIG